MQKDFDKWNKIKKRIDSERSPKFYHTREIWWSSLGVNIGFEQDGSGDEYRRPILILKGLSKNTCLVIPLTASSNDHPMRPSIGIIEGKKARAILSQIRVIDTKCLVDKIGYLDQAIFKRIQKTIKDLL